VRDPRVDPQPGDIVRESGDFGTECIVVRITDDTVYFYEVLSEHRTLDKMLISAWRDRHGTPNSSEVIHVAD
jgi:hypothetical protein